MNFRGFLLRGVAAVLLFGLLPGAAHGDRYVSATGSNTPPYDTWGRAATNIQTALNAANGGETVWATNGTYYLAATVLLTNRVTLRSVNGATATVIHAQNACRAVQMHGTSTLHGFTVTAGDTASGGGGVQCSAATVSDCILDGNRADGGAGVCIWETGIVRNCTIRNNATKTDSAGGGVYAYLGGYVEKCLVVSNRAGRGAGMALLGAASARGCLVADNVATGATWGGGGIMLEAAQPVENCTIVRNSAGTSGGGVYCLAGAGTLRNCIIVSNTAPANPNWVTNAGTVVEYTCTQPAVGGAANITNDPLFVGVSDFRLQGGSPCRNTGTNVGWMGSATDLDGNTRIRTRVVDRGAYEGRWPYYVALGGSHTSPFDTWAKAATNINAAVAAAGDGDEVFVTNGVHYTTGMVLLSNSITLRSMGGAAVTVIDAVGTHPGVHMTVAGALLDGFTVRNGQAGPGGVNVGGGVFCNPGEVWNCIVVSNTAVHGISDGNGGGICLAGNVVDNSYAVNCLVMYNTAEYGGGIYTYGYSFIDHCTVVSNTASVLGGGIRAGDTVRNTICYYNTAPSSPNHSNYYAVGWNANCTTPSWGTACITNPPLFTDVAAGDLRILTNSPCRDAGTNLSWSADGRDLPGNPRRFGEYVDLGAYEIPVVFVSTSGSHTARYETWAKSATNLQSALNVCSNGYYVLVSNGTYRATLEVVVSRAVVMQGVNGAGVTIVDGGDAHRCLRVTTNAWISGLTMTNGHTTANGGGAHVSGRGVLSACVIGGNFAESSYGGGVYIGAGGGSLTNCLLTGNEAMYNGGGVYVEQTGSIDRCAIVGNVATNNVFGQSGGLHVQSGAEIRNSVVRGNIARLIGGALVTPATRLDNCSIVGNTAGNSGGISGAGVLVNSVVYHNLGGSSSNHDTTATWLHSCTAPPMAGAGNTSADPAFADLGAGNLRLASNSPCLNAGTNQPWMQGATDFDGFERIVGGVVDMGAYEVTPVHYVSTAGGHVWPYTNWSAAATNLCDALKVAGWDDTVYVAAGTHALAETAVITQRMSVVGNGAMGGSATIISGGGAARCLNVLTGAVVSAVCIRDGYVSGNAGGVYLTGGGTLRDCRVADNVASQYAGGVMIYRTGIVERCRVEQNAALRCDGGGVYFDNGGAAFSSIIISNTARKGAGAFGYRAATLRNCLVAWNRATNSPGGDAGDGGGVLFFQGGTTCRVENCTIVSNHAGRNGGGLFLSGAGWIVNAVVYGNTAVASTSNYSGSGSGWLNCCVLPSIGSDGVAADPQFRDGASGDWRLAVISPCIHAGINEAWMADATDLAGVWRVCGESVDIGAYEFPFVHAAPGGGNSAPYLTWSAAATNLQAAVNVASNGYWVLVSNGTYRTAGELRLTNTVVLVGVNGPAVTILDGERRHRVIYMNTNALVCGVTVTNGSSATEGGGVRFDNGGRLERCIVTGSYATNNPAYYGGGVCFSNGGSLVNCAVVGNRAYSGGGVYFGSSGEVVNCVVARNQATSRGGGLYFNFSGGAVLNSIVFLNTAGAADATNYAPEGMSANALQYTCAAPLAAGTGNTDADPLFSDPATANFRLRTNSPCMDAASGGPADDLDGGFRPLDGDRDGTAAPDMGAYEFFNPFADSNTNGMPDGWENEHYGTPLSGANPAADEDGDHAINSEEAIADTDPHDASSCLVVTNLFSDGEWRTIQFRSSSNRVYTLQNTTNPAVAGLWRDGGYVRQRGTGGSRSWKETNLPFIVDRVLVELP